MNPADYMNKPFDRIPKPTLSLLQRLIAPPTSSDVPSASTNDSAYKFDFLQDVADVAYASLPLVGDTDSTSVKSSTSGNNLKVPPRTDATITSEDQPSVTLPEHIIDDDLDLVPDSLPRVPSFRAHKRNMARTPNDNPTKLSRLQEENAYLRQILENQRLKARLDAVTGKTSTFTPPDASHVQDSSDRATSSHGRPPSDMADTSQQTGTNMTATS